jgi:molybdopterin-synthase adenylyltransferase
VTQPDCRSATFRPRVKPEHRPYRAAGGAVRIGGTAFGVAAEIVDGDGQVFAMLTAMDGRRTTTDVAARLCADGYPVSVDDVVAAIEKLAAAGYVENAETADRTTLPARQRERSSRTRDFYRSIHRGYADSQWWVPQRLAQSRVTVVGLGGTGLTAAAALVGSGVGALHCVDPDTVELSNLNRQLLYTEHDIGLPKSRAAVARLRAVNSDALVTGERTRVESVAAFERLATDCDVLAVCADEPADIRYWANAAALRTGTPWVDGGYNGPVVAVTSYRPGSGPCYRCVRTTDRELRPGAVAPAGAGPVRTHAVSAASAGLSGNLVAHLVIAALTEVPEVQPGRVTGLNLVALDDHLDREYAARPDCPDCGRP